MLPSIADIAADIPNGANPFLANGTATLIYGPANLPNKFPKNPPIVSFLIIEFLIT